MRDKVFIDTNVIVYLYSEDEPDKQVIAHTLITDGSFDLVISTQVVGEFVNVLSRKFHLDPDRIKMAIDDFNDHFEIALIGIDAIERALALMKKYRYSYWDSMVIASAIENDCTILFSEDLQDRQLVLQQMRIINPFGRNDVTA